MIWKDTYMIWKNVIWRKLFRKGQDTAVDEMLNDAVEKAHRHILEQKLRAISVLSSVPGADEFQDDPEKMLAVELPFMWGWHHAYAKAAGNWPTPPSGRASLQMIHYLMKHHDFDFSLARAEASALDSMWNKADRLFEAISQRGEQSFVQPEEPNLGHIIEQVLNS